MTPILTQELIIVEVNSMSKPSMFSKDYEKEMKRRKIKIVLLIIMPIVGLTIFLITDFNSLLNKGISMKSGINNILLNKSKDDLVNSENKLVEQQKKSAVAVKAQPSTGTSTVPQKEVIATNKVYSVSLSDGEKVSIEYKESGTEKEIIGITNPTNISYDISPSKKALVIQSNKNQDMIYLHVSKSSIDITRKMHTSSRGEEFSKESQLQKHPNYIWSITPKFIDEDNIAYVSELPWINEDAVKYLWKVNLKDNTHVQAKPASGKSITFKNITSKGLETVIDGDTMFVNSSGKVVK